MTRFNKEKQIASESGEQRTEMPGHKGKPMKIMDAKMKQCDHSQKLACKPMPAKGFKQVGK